MFSTGCLIGMNGVGVGFPLSNKLATERMEIGKPEYVGSWKI